MSPKTTWTAQKTPDDRIVWHCDNCGDIWEFNAGTPQENNVKFCQSCGAEIIEFIEIAVKAK